MSLTALLSLAVVHPAWAQQSIHHVDIETLGVFRRIADAAEGPAGEFDDADWLQQDAGMSAASYRYELAFAAYGVAALAQRKAQGIKQNGFAGAGLAGHDAESGLKRKIDLVDQDKVTDGECQQHGEILKDRIPQTRNEGPLVHFGTQVLAHQ